MSIIRFHIDCEGSVNSNDLVPIRVERQVARAISKQIRQICNTVELMVLIMERAAFVLEPGKLLSRECRGFAVWKLHADTSKALVP